MIVDINARHSPGPAPSGHWLWFTARLVSIDDAYPLPSWFCTNDGEPKVIGNGWLEVPRPF